MMSQVFQCFWSFILFLFFEKFILKLILSNHKNKQRDFLYFTQYLISTSQGLTWTETNEEININIVLDHSMCIHKYFD